MCFFSFEKAAKENTTPATSTNRHVSTTSGNNAAIVKVIESGMDSELSPEITAQGLIKKGTESHSQPANAKIKMSKIIPTTGQLRANFPLFSTNSLSRRVKFNCKHPYSVLVGDQVGNASPIKSSLETPIETCH